MMVLHVCNLNTPEVRQVNQSEGHRWLHCEFEASLQYLRPGLKPKLFLPLVAGFVFM